MSILYEQINSLVFILFQRFVDFTQLDQKRTQYNQIERKLEVAKNTYYCFLVFL